MMSGTGDEFAHQPAVPYGHTAMQHILDTAVGPMIRYAARRLGGDYHAGEDIVAQAFLELARRWQKEGALREPRALLNRIVQLRCVDHAKKALPAPMDSEALATLVDRTANKIMNAEFQTGLFTEDLIVRALHLLPVRQRQVLEFRYGYDLDLEDTAAQLKASVPTIKSLQQRGLAALRKSPLLARYRTTAPEVQR